MRKTCIVAALAALPALAAAAHATPVEITNPPISTDYSDPQISLHTHVTKIIMGDPVDDPCLDATRVQGTIEGVGQGGSTIGLDAQGKLIEVTADLEKTYDYKIEYEYVFPNGGGGGRSLLVSFHGGPGTLFAALNVPAAASGGVQRVAVALGRAALRDHDSYFSANRWMRANHQVIATYRKVENPDMVYSPDLAALVNHDYPWLGPVAAGDPLPASVGNDAATMRDVTRAGQYIHELLMGAPPQHTIGMGISGGARMITHIAAGRGPGEPSFSSGRRSGGNYVVPYDPSSGVILEYVMTRGLPDPPGPFWNIDPEYPITAPTVLLMGNADPRQSNAWAYLSALAGLLESAESLDDWARFYQWRGTTHRWGSDEGACGAAPHSDLGPFGPYVGALLANARARIEEGRPEPDSRFAGHLDGNGTLVFEQTGGGTVNYVPFTDDPGDTLNNVFPWPKWPPDPPSQDLVASWKLIDALLPHGLAITPPPLSCRLGLYTVTEGGGAAVPLPKITQVYPDLAVRWPTFGSFKDCYAQAVEALEAEGLYDPHVENVATSAETFRYIFDAAGIKH
jgi:hypothetical protein